ncbi:MAG: helix-turn-helix domain-containing protein [Promethearchaeia archaeon]
MIRDVVIIKDGIPLISKNFADSEKKMFSGANDLVMVSGFFSALNSFSDQFNNLGSINELRLSKNEYKLAFVKDKNIPNLIYLASFDETSKGVNVQRYLRKISRSFLKQYNEQQLKKWGGRTDTFKQFERIIDQYVQKEKKESEAQFKEKVEDLFENVQNHLGEEKRHEEGKTRPNKPQKEKKTIKENNNDNHPYLKNVPKLKVPRDLNPQFYLTGDASIDIFHSINGGLSIEEIAQKLQFSPKKVFNLCKNMVKLGLIEL